jgi:hypothetical protein
MAGKLYESELTQFLRDLRAQRPELAEQARSGRALWWDKTLDADEQRAFRVSRVPQKPYVYQTGE